MVLKTANAVPPSQQNRARQPRQGTAKSTKSTASSSSSVGRGAGNDGGRRHNRTSSGAAGSAAASSNVPSGSKPTPKKKKKKPATKKKEEESHEPVRRTVKPPNQLVLTGAERAEEVSLLLTAADPNRPKNAVVSFSHRDMCFKPDPPGQGDNMAVHFSLAGSMMHVDSDEYKRYEEAEARSREREEALLADEGGDGVVVPAASTADGDAAAGIRGGRAKNQFNFSERATQSHNNPLKDRAAHTEPPPVTQYSDERSESELRGQTRVDRVVAGRGRRSVVVVVRRRRERAGGRRHDPQRVDGVGPQDDGAPREPERRGRDLPGLQVLRGPGRLDQEGGGNAPPALEVHVGQVGPEAGHVPRLESAIRRPLRRVLRVVRLPEAGVRHGLLLLAEEHEPPRVRHTDRERRDVPRLPPASPVAARRGVLRRHGPRVRHRREAQQADLLVVAPVGEALGSRLGGPLARRPRVLLLLEGAQLLLRVERRQGRELDNEQERAQDGDDHAPQARESGVEEGGLLPRRRRRRRADAVGPRRRVHIRLQREARQPLPRRDRGGEHPRVLEGVQRTVHQHLRRPPHGRACGAVEPVPRGHIHLVLGGLDRQDLGSQRSEVPPSFRPRQRRRGRLLVALLVDGIRGRYYGREGARVRPGAEQAGSALRPEDRQEVEADERRLQPQGLHTDRGGRSGRRALAQAVAEPEEGGRGGGRGGGGGDTRLRFCAEVEAEGNPRVLGKLATQLLRL
ncbi:hypothetical protein THAOC_07893 [Thalassiosira oceanica]|uniref:Uncharacterized protein n=1 Tax=Thalassiosira oceanica TaxID=159749 RepID=K0TBE2_THAOC|nr:hypothetical protein THAOC_07893 [Thalassiosira oceanica]|eukprot:EJK70726.1 hypothetical protein THAOC_07893 [Thalassiosira oceanica]